MPADYKRVPTDPDEREPHGSQRGSHHRDQTQVPSVAEQDAHVGVTKVQASLRIYGRYGRWCLWISLALASYIYSLDASTTPAYLTFAASSFGEHSLLGSIGVVQYLIVAVGKPVIAKIADVSSRGRGFASVLFFYVLGYTVMASAPNVGAMAGGLIVYAIGNTGLQILTQIIIADFTTLKWRGLVVSLISSPFLINAWIGANISTAVIEHLGWRWGYGMFAILVPLSLSPLIITLLWAEHKTKKLGLVEPALDSPDTTVRPDLSNDTLFVRLRRIVEQLDLVGLVLLGTAVSLILLPLTLSNSAENKWKNASVLSMLVIGVAFFFLFIYWDFRIATRPVLARRFLKNRSVVFAALIGFFDFMSFYLTFTYLYSFVLIVKPWSLIQATYFMQIVTISLTFFGILAGFCMRFMRRYKRILVVGLLIRLAGVAMMIHSRGANGSTAELVCTQILQGLGGGLAAVAAQVGFQAAVTHADVAMITALVLLFTEIGSAVGNAGAGAIWSNTMPGNLKRYLPWLTDAQREELYGSITSVTAYPRGDPVREGVIQAYDDTMKIMILCAIAFSVLPVFFALGMQDWYLGDKQNAVDSTNLTGGVSLEQEEDGGDSDADADADGRS